MVTLAQRHPQIPPFVPNRSRVSHGLTPGWLYCELFNAEGECYATAFNWSPFLLFGPPAFEDLVRSAKLAPQNWQRDRWEHPSPAV